MGSPQRVGGLQNPKRLLWLAIPAALLLAGALTAIFNARRALNRASQVASSEGGIPFILRSLDTSDSAKSLRAETVASRPNYTTGALLLGDLYLGGQSGLTIRHADGTLRLNLRTGFELPVAPIQAMSVGRVRGASQPQLLIATGGSGLLLLEPGSGANPTIHQLLPTALAGRDLTAVLPLATGDLLLGTRHHGVLIYNGATLVPLHFTLPEVNPATLQITALAAVDAASFLIGTRDSGVLYAHGGTYDHVTSASGLPDDQVESIAVSSAHAFVGTPTGIAEFDLTDPSFHPVRLLAKNLFSHTLRVDEHQLIIGTLDQGVQQVPLEAGPAFRHISVSADSAAPSSQRVDAFIPGGDVLYALVDGDLVRHSGADWTPAIPAEPATLSDQNISALAFAPDGTLYIGFFDHGLDLLSPGGSVRHIENDAIFCINRLVLDTQRQTMDVATANGLVLFDSQGRPRQTLTHRDGLISDHITDITFSSSGTVLATPAGMTFLTPAGTESLYAFQGLVNNHVYALAATGESGQIIAGTLGGISIVQSRAVERNFTISNSALKHNWITSLLPLPDNSVLIGTYGAGLETMDRVGHFAPVELPSGAPRDLVINPNAIYTTSTHIYAGTLCNGMLVFSISTGRWSVMNTGLPSLNVTAFAARGGDIYIGTENGLVRISEASLP